MSKQVQLLIHLLGVAFFLLLCFWASPDWPRIDRMLMNPYGMSDFIFQLEMIGFFYLNFYLLLPRLYFSRRYVPYVICIVLLFILLVPGTNYLTESFSSPMPHRAGGHGHRPPFPLFINARVYLFILMIVLSILIKTLSHLREIRQKKILSELELLKAQINPHFFFNTLNLIYSLSVENSPKTPETVLRLSEMMRYVLKDTTSTFVALDKELSYIRNYVEMQVLRLDPRIRTEFICSDESDQMSIAPMILIPFIENTFKHGIPDEGEALIRIHIEVSGKALSLYTLNRKRQNTSPHDTTQIGQNNSYRRLELLYPGKHTLTISEKETNYELQLHLSLST